jgi:hypothetical protein
MNIDTIDVVGIGAIAVIPVITLIVQAIKMTGWRMADKFAPLLSIAIGIIIGFIANHNTADLSNTILTGVIMGLSASGLYSGVKVTAHSVKGGETNATNNQK